MMGGGVAGGGVVGVGVALKGKNGHQQNNTVTQKPQPKITVASCSVGSFWDLLLIKSLVSVM